MIIEELPLNDDYAQCFYKLNIRTLENRNNAKEKMENCNHLFLKLKEGETISGFHSSDYYYDPSYVECVHCGLTNKYGKIEEMISRRLGSYRSIKTLETEIFNKVFKDAYCRGGKSFNEGVFNLISEEVLPTYHPGLLYQIAIQINPNADRNEVFEIMRELHSIETIQENLRLKQIEQAQDLISRYYELNNSKVLEKKNN